MKRLGISNLINSKSLQLLNLLRLLVSKKLIRGKNVQNKKERHLDRNAKSWFHFRLISFLLMLRRKTNKLKITLSLLFQSIAICFQQQVKYQFQNRLHPWSQQRLSMLQYINLQRQLKRMKKKLKKEKQQTFWKETNQEISFLRKKRKKGLLQLWLPAVGM